MVFNKVEPDYYEDRKHIIEQLTRFNKPFEFSEDVSLAIQAAAVEKIRLADAEYNASIDATEALRLKRLAAIEEEKRVSKAILTCIAGTKGKNSDEYVAAGGKRQSELEALQQQGRENKKKAADDAAKKAADEAGQKVIDAAVKKALDDAAKKAADDAKT